MNLLKKNSRSAKEQKKTKRQNQGETACAIKKSYDEEMICEEMVSMNSMCH